MNWIDIIGAIGGSAGIVALLKAGIDIYNAKSNRNTVDISNMEKMLNDAMQRYDKLEKKFDEFQDKSHTYVEGLRNRIVKLEDLDRSKEHRIQTLERSVTQAYRCKYPENIMDCPVIKDYENRHNCAECEHAIEK